MATGRDAELYVVGTREDKDRIEKRIYVPGPGGSRNFDWEKFERVVEETR